MHSSRRLSVCGYYYTAFIAPCQVLFSFFCSFQSTHAGRGTINHEKPRPHATRHQLIYRMTPLSSYAHAETTFSPSEEYTTHLPADVCGSLSRRCFRALRDDEKNAMSYPAPSKTLTKYLTSSPHTNGQSSSPFSGAVSCRPPRSCKSFTCTSRLTYVFPPVPSCV